jgi:hypothetical protein
VKGGGSAGQWCVYVSSPYTLLRFQESVQF